MEARSSPPRSNASSNKLIKITPRKRHNRRARSARSSPLQQQQSKKKSTASGLARQKKQNSSNKNNIPSGKALLYEGLSGWVPIAKRLQKKKNLNFSGSGNWRYYSDQVQLIARSSDEKNLIVQSTGEKSKLYTISPGSWEKKTTARSIPLGLDEATRTLSFLEGETTQISNKNKIEKLRAKRQREKAAVEQGVKDIKSGKPYVDKLHNTQMEEICNDATNSICSNTDDVHKMVDCILKNTALDNSAARNQPISIIVQRKRLVREDSRYLGVHPPQCHNPQHFTPHGCGMCPLLHETGVVQPDAADESFTNRSAHLFQTRDGVMWRILPKNLDSQILAFREFHKQPQSNLTSRRESTMRSNPLLQVASSSVDVKTLVQMREQGHFDKKKAQVDACVPAVVAAGVVSVIRHNRRMRGENRSSVKQAVQNLVKSTVKITAESRERKLKIEKQVLIQIVEEKMKDFIETGCSAETQFDNSLDELVAIAKKRAPLSWAVFSVLGRAPRDDRNILNTPAQKDRNVLKAMLTTMRSGNEKILPYSAIFFSMVRLCGGANYAQLDRMAKEGLCAKASVVVAFFKSRLPDYSTFTYGDKIDILWDNVNLYIRKKYGSTHDGSESAQQDSTVCIIRKHVSDPLGTKSTITQVPTHEEYVAVIDTNPYSLTDTNSGAKVPFGYKYFHLLPKQEQEHIKDLPNVMMDTESSQDRHDVGVANWYFDALQHSMDLAAGKAMSEEQHSLFCGAVGLVGPVLQASKVLAAAVTASHSISATGYANVENDAEKQRVAQTCVVKHDCCVLDANEMSIEGTVHVMRTLFGRTTLRLTFEDVYNVLSGRAPLHMTIRISGDQGSQSLIASVLLRCVLGMKSSDYKVALFCAQVYVMIISSFRRGDPLHEYHIHGIQMLYKLLYPNGLQAMVTAISSKSISPERAKDAADRHVDVLQKVGRSRFFVTFLQLVESGELLNCVVQKKLYSFIDPNLFIPLLASHLEKGGANYKHQGKHLLEVIAAHAATEQAMRHGDTTMMDTQSKYTLCIHKLLGKKYAALLMKEMEERHFWSDYAEWIYKKETLLKLNGKKSTAYTDLGNVIENKGVKAAKSRDSIYHQNLYCGNSQLVENAFRMMYDSKDRFTIRNFTKTPRHLKTIQRLIQLFQRSKAADPENVLDVKDGVARMWEVTDAFVAADVLVKTEKKNEEAKSTSSESSNSGGLVGTEHTLADEKNIRLKMKEMGKNNGNDEVWGKKPAILKPPKERFPVNPLYFTTYRSKFDTSKDSKIAVDRKKKHRLIAYLCKEGVDAFLETHCKNSNDANNQHKEPIELSVLPEIDVGSLSPDFLEWYTLVQEQQENEDLQYKTGEEFVGE